MPQERIVVGVSFCGDVDTKWDLLRSDRVDIEKLFVLALKGVIDIKFDALRLGFDQALIWGFQQIFHT